MKNQKQKKHIFIMVVFFLATILMGIGYATVNNVTLDLSGSASMASDGEASITSVTLLESSNNLTTISDPVIENNTVNFHITFSVGSRDELSDDYYVIYEVTFTNDSLSDYNFSSQTFNLSSATNADENLSVSYEFLNIDLTEPVPKKTTKTFQVRINMYPTAAETDYDVSGSTGVEVTEEETGIVVGSLVATDNETGNTVGNLSGSNTVANFQTSVMNTNSTSKQFTFEIDSQNFEITDSSGNALSAMTINANTTDTFQFSIHRLNNNKYTKSPQVLNVYLKPVDEPRSSMGIVQLIVDVDQTLTDATPPTVSGVTPEFQTTVGSVLVSWTGSDDVGIDHYLVEAYDSSDTVVASSSTVADETSLTITGLANGDYYFKVTAYDTSNNSSSAQSTQETYTWTFTVTYSLTNASSTGSNSDIVNYGDTYSVTLSGNTGYDIPSSSNVSVRMGGTTTSSYTYNANTGRLQITNVTGNLEIRATAQQTSTNPCIVEGTDVLMADGTFKKAEDIDYDDLIMAYSHETGEFVGEYPIWLERKHYSDYYQLTTFTDGSILKTVGTHAVFGVKENEYIDVTDPLTFHEGTQILKAQKTENGYEWTVATVASIEIVEERVAYFHIVSTRYYNMIANMMLTSDGRIFLSNFYGFKENAMWSDRRQEVLENNIQTPYEEIDYMPYYLYKGLRAQDREVLIHYGYINDMQFRGVFEYILLNPAMTKDPLTKDGKRVWMVTTDLDDVNDFNRSSYLHEEGSTYILPSVEGITSWYSTSENKTYLPNDEVVIWHGMHFVSNKKVSY